LVFNPRQVSVRSPPSRMSTEPNLMSAPSTPSYMPFNPKALTFFKEVQDSNYLNVAFLMLLLYDHAITLDKEVAWIWTLRWRLPKIVFLLNRYVITLLVLLQRIPSFIFPLSIPFCHFYHDFLSSIPFFNLVSAELIIMTRVSALCTSFLLTVSSPAQNSDRWAP